MEVNESSVKLLQACLAQDTAAVERHLLKGACPYFPVLTNNHSVLCTVSDLISKYHTSVYTLNNPTQRTKKVKEICKFGDKSDPEWVYYTNYSMFEFDSDTDEEEPDPPPTGDDYHYLRPGDSILENKRIEFSDISSDKLTMILDLLLRHRKTEDVKEITSCFHTCARTHNLDLVKVIINNRISPDLRNQRQNTVLHTVCGQKNVKDPCEVVMFMGEYIADINAVNEEGFTALHLAVQNLYVETVRYLLEVQKANPNIRSTDQHAKETPLFMILYRDHYNQQHTSSPPSLARIGDIVWLLLNNGAVSRTLSGINLYHCFFLGWLPELWDKLSPRYDHYANETDDKGNMPLHAVYKTDTYFLKKENEYLFVHVKYLLNAGATLFHRNKENMLATCNMGMMVRNGQKLMLDILGTPGGHIYEYQAHELMYNFIPAVIKHMFLLMCAGFNHANLQTHRGNLVQFLFVKTVEQWVLEEYLHVYGVRLNPLHPFAFNDDEKSPKSKHQCEVRDLRHIAAQAIRQNLHPNAFVGLKALGLPSPINKMIIPDLLPDELVRKSVIRYRTLILDWRNLLNF